MNFSCSPQDGTGGPIQTSAIQANKDVLMYITPRLFAREEAQAFGSGFCSLLVRWGIFGNFLFRVRMNILTRVPPGPCLPVGR